MKQRSKKAAHLKRMGKKQLHWERAGLRNYLHMTKPSDFSYQIKAPENGEHKVYVYYKDQEIAHNTFKEGQREEIYNWIREVQTQYTLPNQQ